MKNIIKNNSRIIRFFRMRGRFKKNYVFYLLTLRWSVILASALIYFAAIHKSRVVVPPPVVLGVLVCINFLITLFIVKYLKNIERLNLWILILDILQGTLAVSLTGGYSSFFFVLYLLSFFETGLYFPWKTAARWIVVIDGLQVLSSTLSWYVSGTIVSTNLLVSRFISLLIVGLIVILLGELLRREESSRKNALLSARNFMKLNEIYSKLEGSAFDENTIIQILLENVSYIGKILYSFIIFRIDPESDTWEIKATNNPELFPIGSVLKNLVNYTYKSSLIRKYVTDPDINSNFFKEGAEEVVGVNLSDYEDIKGLLIIGKNLNEDLISDEDFFLKALALETQLALHNTYLFGEKQKQIKFLDEFKERQATFFSAAGHEIKTPISILKSLRSTLELTINEPSSSQIEILQTMEANINRLDNLTTDILETARLEGSELTIHKTGIDIIKIIRGRVNLVLPIAKKKSQNILFKIYKCRDHPVFPLVFGDRKRISEIVSNLLTNAIKFSPSDSVIIITAVPLEGNVIIGIYDKGAFIPPSEQQRIFEKYYTSSSDKALTGFGLGLYIAKRLVELHDGRIWIDDRFRRKGFCFSIPISEEDSTYED